MIADLEARIILLTDDLFYARASVARMTVDLEQAKRQLAHRDAEIAMLRADKERLDWLTDALDWVELGKCVATDYDEEGRSRLDAWRMAIDAARKEAQP